MHHVINIKSFAFFFPALCSYVFRLIFTINSDNFRKEHQPAGEECALISVS
jgi:hypothetical protein